MPQATLTGGLRPIVEIRNFKARERGKRVTPSLARRASVDSILRGILGKMTAIPFR